MASDTQKHILNEADFNEIIDDGVIYFFNQYTGGGALMSTRKSCQTRADAAANDALTAARIMQIFA